MEIISVIHIYIEHRCYTEISLIHFYNHEMRTESFSDLQVSCLLCPFEHSSPVNSSWATPVKLLSTNIRSQQVMSLVSKSDFSVTDIPNPKHWSPQPPKGQSQVFQVQEQICAYKSPQLQAKTPPSLSPLVSLSHQRPGPSNHTAFQFSPSRQ